MTDREKAIVMAYTGVTMLTGDKLGIFYEYIEELLGHPVMTHELAGQNIQDEITRKSKEDFIALCRDDSAAEYDMNDLITRKAALEAVKIPNGEYSNPSERHGIIIARVEATKRIMDIPSVPAVPSKPLYDYLEVYARTPVYNMRHTAKWWKEDLERERQKWEAWEKNQDATN